MLKIYIIKNVIFKKETLYTVDLTPKNIRQVPPHIVSLNKINKINKISLNWLL